MGDMGVKCYHLLCVACLGMGEALEGFSYNTSSASQN